MRLKREAILNHVNVIISLVLFLIYITCHFISYSAEDTVAIGKTNYLLLFREVISIYAKNHKSTLTINNFIEEVQNFFLLGMLVHYVVTFWLKMLAL
jgi:hypothetical protein